MTKKQALSLLTLIADLYAIVNTPDHVEPQSVPGSSNGEGTSKHSHPMTVD